MKAKHSLCGPGVGPTVEVDPSENRQAVSVVLDPEYSEFWQDHYNYTGADLDFDAEYCEWRKPLMANLDCPTTRLAYADWLTEQGLFQRAERQKWIAAKLLGQVS